MSPHIYAIDSQNKAHDLSTQILSSPSTSQSISTLCSSIQSFLDKRTTDQSRSFFSITFPSLIYKLFGFDHLSSHSPDAWIDSTTSSPHLTSRLFDLLSPSGTLFSAISAIDHTALIKYVFPVERLPEWVKFLLQNPKDSLILSDICPLFKGRLIRDHVKGCFQVQLNAFEYFMFWFAYYPVCKANSETLDTNVVKKSLKLTRLENWTWTSTSFFGGKTGGPGRSGTVEQGLYVRLLYAYLQVFVPNYGSEGSQPYRSSLLHYSSGYDGSLMLQMEFFVCTLVHFWLVDNDFSPLPVNVCRSFGVSFPFRVVLGETPPTPGLADVVSLFVKYLNSSLVSVSHGSKSVEHKGSPRISGGVEFGSSPVSRVSTGSSVGSWNSLIQRPLYRFILRTFLFCPAGTSIKNASQVFSLWISYIEPWKITSEDFSELDGFMDQKPESSRDEKSHSKVGNGARKNNRQAACGYTSSWENYVLTNYLFYSSLTMHFLGFAHKFLHTDVETIVQIALKVLNILTSSRELMDLIKKVDAAFHSKMPGSPSLKFDSAYKCVPAIREQLQDWEDGLCETDADGSFLHENWNQDLRLLSDGEDGGHQLLQLLILRAESEVQALSGDNASQSIQNLESLKAQMGCLFDGRIEPVTPNVKQFQCTRDEVFKPRWVGNYKLSDVKYKGDWMKRPASNSEVAWLARLLVRLSDWLNKTLRLNQGHNNCMSQSSFLLVDVSDNDVSKVDGPKEAITMILSSVWSWFIFLCLTVGNFMREHRLRVNLRVLASKKILVLLLLLAAFSILKKVFCSHLHQPIRQNR